jgi:membrane associated rhomboid family serine protease
MAGSRVCPHCQGLNGADETRCFRCGRRLPGPWLGALTTLWDDLLGRDFPLTKLFWGICIVVYAACIAIDGRPAFGFSEGQRFSTLLRFGLLFGALVDEEPWRLLSAVFVHFNVWHVIFNSMALVDLGRRVEVDLGSARFAVLFVATGIFGFVVSTWWYHPSVPTCGASGAIFGLLGVEVGQIIARRRPDLGWTLFRVFAFAVLLSLVFRANLAAHLGGLIAGGLFGFLFQKERRSEWLGRVVVVLAVSSVLASLGSIGLANGSQRWKEARAMEELRLH